MGHTSARDAIKGTLREGSFTGEPERGSFGDIYKMPCRRASLFIGAQLGKLEWVRLPGLLRKEKYIWVPFWTWRPLRL